MSSFCYKKNGQVVAIDTNADDEGDDVLSMVFETTDNVKIDFSRGTFSHVAYLSTRVNLDAPFLPRDVDTMSFQNCFVFGSRPYYDVTKLIICEGDISHSSVLNTCFPCVKNVTCTLPYVPYLPDYVDEITLYEGIPFSLDCAASLLQRYKHLSTLSIQLVTMQDAKRFMELCYRHKLSDQCLMRLSGNSYAKQEVFRRWVAVRILNRRFLSKYLYWVPKSGT